MAADQFVRLWDNGGVPVHADLTLEDTPTGAAVTLESRSGSLAGGRTRNPGNIDALDLVLERLADAGCTLIEASVESRPAQKLPVAARRLPMPWPIKLRPGMDVRQLRLLIGDGQRTVASDPNKVHGTGNAQKRLRLNVGAATVSDAAGLWRLISGGQSHH